jgi:NhaC family Na+:H+ antiporter
MSSTLSVSAAAYFPYAFLNLLTPVIAVIIGYTGFRIATLAEPGREAAQQR